LLHETGCAKRLAVRLPVSLRLGVARAKAAMSESGTTGERSA
jgi:hypothetical protein